MMRRPRIVLVCGGRDYADREHVFETLNTISLERCPLPPGCDWSTESGIARIVHGCARGADSLAHQWARNHSVEVERFPADWAKHGKGAGARRNTAMAARLVSLSDAFGRDSVLVLAFPGGSGTANMIAQARGKQLTVRSCCDQHSLPGATASATAESPDASS